METGFGPRGFLVGCGFWWLERVRVALRERLELMKEYSIR